MIVIPPPRTPARTPPRSSIVEPVRNFIVGKASGAGRWRTVLGLRLGGWGRVAVGVWQRGWRWGCGSSGRAIVVDGWQSDSSGWVAVDGWVCGCGCGCGLAPGAAAAAAAAVGMGSRGFGAWGREQGRAEALGWAEGLRVARLERGREQ